MKPARPMVMAGNMKWKLIVSANWIRDRVSTSTDGLLRLGGTAVRAETYSKAIIMTIARRQYEKPGLPSAVWRTPGRCWRGGRAILPQRHPLGPATTVR